MLGVPLAPQAVPKGQVEQTMVPPHPSPAVPHPTPTAAHEGAGTQGPPPEPHWLGVPPPPQVLGEVQLNFEDQLTPISKKSKFNRRSKQSHIEARTRDSIIPILPGVPRLPNSHVPYGKIFPLLEPLRKFWKSSLKSEKSGPR